MRFAALLLLLGLGCNVHSRPIVGKPAPPPAAKCAGDPYCECGVDVDCGQGFYCSAEHRVCYATIPHEPSVDGACRDVTDCIAGVECRQGWCQGCRTDEQCPDGRCLENVCGPVDGCTRDEDCEMDELCDDGVCIFVS